MTPKTFRAWLHLHSPLKPHVGRLWRSDDGAPAVQVEQQEIGKGFAASPAVNDDREAP